MPFRTAEAVSPAHPDKVADQISDAILTEVMRRDPAGRVAVETLIGHSTCAIVGEITAKMDAPVNVSDVAAAVLTELGYDPNALSFVVDVHEQSPDIAKGVDNGGAGDQGIMIGYACRDNEEMIPQELYLARKILKAIVTKYGMRDAKAQVTLDPAGRAYRVVVSAEKLTEAEVREAVDFNAILEKVDAHIIINPAGPWTGGLDADTGVTGRKIVQDAYGPRVPVGGGAFSGKDATKVDRSAAYAARRMALSILKATPDAHEVRVEVAYAIGLAAPLALQVFIDGKPAELGETHANALEMLEPANIIRDLRLDATDFRKVAAWGSFGNKDFTWEQIV